MNIVPNGTENYDWVNTVRVGKLGISNSKFQVHPDEIYNGHIPIKKDDKIIIPNIGTHTVTNVTPKGEVSITGNVNGFANKVLKLK